MKNSTLTADDARLPAIVERLKAGASLTEESKALGYSNNHCLRNALRGSIGREKYDALMAGRADLGMKRWRAAQAAKSEPGR